jgi:hypothetical protein
MARPQGSAARLLAGAHAMTDVTGFGLAGHLLNILDASGTGATLDLAALPLLDGALDLAAKASARRYGRPTAPPPRRGCVEDDARARRCSSIRRPRAAFSPPVPGPRREARPASLHEEGYSAGAIGTVTGGSALIERAEHTGGQRLDAGLVEPHGLEPRHRRAVPARPVPRSAGRNAPRRAPPPGPRTVPPPRALPGRDTLRPLQGPQRGERPQARRASAVRSA